jgi:hypothetical protein
VNVGSLDVAQALGTKLRDDFLLDNPFCFTRPRLPKVASDVAFNEQIGDALNAVAGI